MRCVAVNFEIAQKQKLYIEGTPVGNTFVLEKHPYIAKKKKSSCSDVVFQLFEKDMLCKTGMKTHFRIQRSKRGMWTGEEAEIFSSVIKD